MSTSTYGGRVRTATLRLQAEEDVSSRTLRRLANNAHHYADSKCNHLVNWVAARSSLLASGVGYLTPDTKTSDFARLASWGPLPLTLHPDRNAYPVRLALAGAASAADAVTFAAVLVPELDYGDDVVNDSALIDDAGVIFAPTSSSTPAWLAVDVGAAFFTPSRSIVAGGIARRQTLTDTAGGIATVDTCEVFLSIYAKTADLATTPRLYGVHLSEYVGT